MEKDGPYGLVNGARLVVLWLKMYMKGRTMKFIHLSDLHIGKRVNGFSMLEDQKYILDQIVMIAEEEMPDGVLIAGDVYDKPVPPAEAVQVFDAFLTGLADRNLPVFVISGNHDSPERLAFGGQLMKDRRVYMAPVYDGHLEPVQLEDRYGSLRVYMLPFIKPAVVRRCCPEEGIETFEDAVRWALEHMAEHKKGEDGRNILIAHQFVTGASCCDSEELSIGGLDQVAEPSVRRDLAFIPVMDIQDTFVTTPNYLENLYLREGQDTSLFETGNIMLLDTSNMTRHHVDEYMAENNIFPHQILEVTTMDLLIEFAKIGLGIACVIKELVQKELDSGMLVEIPLDIPIHRRTIGFAYHPANQAMALKTFLEFLY